MSTPVPFEQILQRTFGSGPPPPEPTPVPVVPEPEPEPEPPPKKETKTVRDPRIAAEAQRIYKPDLPPAPPKTKVDQGVASRLDLQGTWGAPEEQPL